MWRLNSSKAANVILPHRCPKLTESALPPTSSHSHCRHTPSFGFKPRSFASSWTRASSGMAQCSHAGYAHTPLSRVCRSAAGRGCASFYNASRPQQLPGFKYTADSQRCCSRCRPPSTCSLLPHAHLPALPAGRIGLRGSASITDRLSDGYRSFSPAGRKHTAAHKSFSDRQACVHTVHQASTLPADSIVCEGQLKPSKAQEDRQTVRQATAVPDSSSGFEGQPADVYALLEKMRAACWAKLPADVEIVQRGTGTHLGLAVTWTNAARSSGAYHEVRRV